MFWIGCLHRAHSVSSFCDFHKITFCDFTTFFSYLTLSKPLFFSSDVPLRSIKPPNLCPNMINFDGLDFSERRSEEVISCFWCSVYFLSFILHTVTLFSPCLLTCTFATTRSIPHTVNYVIITLKHYRHHLTVVFCTFIVINNGRLAFTWCCAVKFCIQGFYFYDHRFHYISHAFVSWSVLNIDYHSFP